MGFHHLRSNALKSTVALAAIAAVAVGCSSQADERAASIDSRPAQVASNDSLVGPAGYTGPAGPAGEQGPIGQTGATGYGETGPRGADGIAGPTGEQGATGPKGASGAVIVGARGPTGDVGPAGAQGEAGETGARGAGWVGDAGPAGADGPVGARGPTGEAGAQGDTLVGPEGPAGDRGASGTQGASGDTGATGFSSQGRTGATGATGETGAQGSVGLAGGQGPVGVVDRWTRYRVITFDSGRSDIHSSEMAQVSDIADYMRQNPSLRLGIDGSTNSRISDQTLNERRVGAVRDALILAGTPAYKIETGAFGDPQLRREGQVALMLISAQYISSR
jgi:outer membrane protein OmpA-like peptidoglycan-associated protein